MSPLPPPVTRGLYRSRWFEFLDAHTEDDSRGAAVALAELKRAAQMVGVRSLSDFSRTAAYEGRHAEEQGKLDRAARAFDAALALDDGNCDAQFARVGFLVRRRSLQEAVEALPGATSSLLATHESRLSVLSMFLTWAAAGLAAAGLGTIVILIVRHARLWVHDLREISKRFFGPGSGVPLGLVIAGVPLAFGLGPLWILLYWGALVYPSCRPRERGVLAAALVVLGLIPPTTAAISRENILERSPLYVAAVDLEEKREDASAEDGLRQASTVFADDPDVWLLLGIYAERSADPERALTAYERAVLAGPNEYQPLMNRGNIHYQEGNFAQAIRDYEAATEIAPRAAEVYYNLALARAEAYDFVGQAAALQKARQISAGDVSYWSDHPTLSRVVSASYPVSRARRRIEEWNRKPAGRRLPGYAPFSSVTAAFLSPFALGPWAVLVLALVLQLVRSWRGLATECSQCGQPTCKYCRRYGDPLGLCGTCSRQRRESRVIDVQVRRADLTRRLARRRTWLCRLLSLFLPGTHGFFSRRPVSGFLTLCSSSSSPHPPSSTARSSALDSSRRRAGGRASPSWRWRSHFSSGHGPSCRPGVVRMGLEGTLAAFSVTDLFQVLSLQKKTGTLTVEGKSDTVAVSFLGGEIVWADSTARSLEARVGDLLVRSGRLAQEDLTRVRKSREREERLSVLLVRQRLVSSGVLHEALRLEIGRIVLAAFRWTEGRFRFRQEGAIERDGALLSPIPADALLIDAVQMLDEWPKLEKKVSSRDMVYRRAPGLEDLRLVLSAEENGEGALVVSEREAEVWQWMDGNRPVAGILDRAFLSDLDAYRGLADLLERNLIVQARLSSPAEAQPASPGPAISARAVGLWTLVLPMATLAIRETPRKQWDLTLRQVVQRQEVADLLKAASLGRLASIERALRVYYDSTGQYPKRIEDLLEKGVLTREAITDPFGRPYRYILRSEDGKFSLYGRNPQGNIDVDLAFERSLAPVSESQPARAVKPPEPKPGVRIIR